MAYLAGQGAFTDREQYPLPGLVILDLKLPRKSGFDVLAWLRQQPGLERLPVIVLTNHKEIPDINDAYDLGANFYMVKSVAFTALQDMVQTIARILTST
jgi:DNA-binding response OmpR family regulator